MKNSILKSSLVFALLMSFSFATNAQETKTDPTETKTDSTEKGNDDWKISFGKTKIIIQKDGDSDTLDLSDKDGEKKEKKVEQRYNHFAGIDFGVNGFVNPNQSIALYGDADFLELNYRRSFEVSINFWEKHIPIWKEKIGLVTGFGVKYNNYTIAKDVRIINSMDSTFAVEDPDRKITKNRFKTSAVHVPLMLETNIGKDAEHSFHLAAGGTVTYILNARTKQKYEEDGKNFKKKDKNDFNVNPFQFAATARVGYGDFTLYATYNLTPLFENNKGPEVIPFTVGVSIMTF